MWPFGARPTLPEALDRPTPIDVLAKVVSPNEVLSPVSGAKAAFVRIEVLERLPDASQSSWLGGGIPTSACSERS